MSVEIDIFNNNFEQDINNPDIYWSNNKISFDVFFSLLLKGEDRFGLEIGFGDQQITNVSLLDPTINWVATEMLIERYQQAKSGLYYQPLEKIVMNNAKKIYAFNAITDLSQILSVPVILFKNPNPISMKDIIPQESQLKFGQRFILVVNDTYINDSYPEMLDDLGYNSRHFIERDSKLPPFNKLGNVNQKEFVFDYFKK